METRQAIYDAVRSRIGSCDIGDVVREVMDFSHIAAQVAEDARWLVDQHAKPHAIMRPSIAQDGNKWCALYGANLMEGVVGFGDSPAEAMEDFDKNWQAKLGGAS